MCDRWCTAVYNTVVFRDVPNGYRARFADVVRTLVHAGVSYIARALRTFERSLSRASRRMISKRGADSNGTASHYLKNITPESRAPGE